jgi:cytochrome c553
VNLASTALAAAVTTLGVTAFAQTSGGDSGYDQRFVSQCEPCHGERGQGSRTAAPALAGQPSFYAITQLFLFRGGRRANPEMTAVARDFSDDDLRGFADAIGRLPAPGVGAVLDAARPEADSQRWSRGRQLALAFHCNACHGPAFEGGKQTPRLAGQREDYLLRALVEFRAGKRLGYTNAMAEALVGLDPTQLADLAFYLAAWAPDAVATKGPAAALSTASAASSR